MLLELPALPRLRCLIISGALGDREIQKLTSQLSNLPNLRFLEMKYSAMTPICLHEVVRTTTKLKLVSIVEYSDYLTTEICEEFKGTMRGFGYIKC